MGIQEVDKKKMEALNFLAQTNMKIGEARTMLQKLQEEETSYLVAREKKVLDRIDAVLVESAALLEESAGNYEKVKELYDRVSEFLELVNVCHTDFEQFRVLALEKIALEERRLINIETGFANQRQEINVLKVKMQNWEKTLQQKEEQLLIDARKVASDRGVVERAIKRLKEGKI